jgi:hypothetical protein
MSNTVDRNGINGGRLITSATGAVTGVNFTTVMILEDDTTFSTWTNLLYLSGAGIGQALTTRTWKRGDIVFGNTTALTCTAGACQGIVAS